MKNYNDLPINVSYLLLLPIESAAATVPTAPAVPIAAVDPAPKPNKKHYLLC